MLNQPPTDPIDQLINEVTQPGRVPLHRRAMQQQHRNEWPTLWAAIDRIINERIRP